MTDSARATRESSAKTAHRAPASSHPFDATVLPESDPTIGARPDEWVGKIVGGRYRVDALLGEGGMGRVYKAEHVHMRKNVALKLLHREMTFIPEAVARFEREAVAAARISHPHVATALDFGRAESDGQFYLALEFVEGRSLRAVLEEEGNLPVSRVVEIVRQVADALQAAHAQGVVHRDLKPDNIMLVSAEAGDSIKVLDFGIAKVSSESAGSGQQLTRMGAIFGTPEYMSPEQAAGQTVDHKSDLYALGIILYEMLTGSPPFVAGTMTAVLLDHLQREPEPLPSTVPTAVAELTLALLAKAPEDRPDSAADVVRSLRIARLSALPPARAAGLRPLAHKLAIATAVRSIQVWQRLVQVSRRIRRWLLPRLERQWRRAIFRFPALRKLHVTVPLGTRRVHLGWLLALAMSALVVLLITLVASSPETEAVNVAPAAETAGEADHVSEPEQTETRPDQARLDEIVAVPVYKRNRQQWIELGALYESRQSWKESLFAYRNALQLAPELKDDPQLVQRLRSLAEQPEIYDSVLNVAINLLGTAGMDLAYDLWRTTRSDPDEFLINEAAAKYLEIHRIRSASPALRALLELQFMGGACDKTDRLLKDALKHADERILPLLAAQKSGACGKTGQEPCVPCLQRPGVNLERLKVAVGKRKGPRFTGDAYIKPGR